MESLIKIFYTMCKAIIIAFLSALFVHFYDIAASLSFVPANRTFVFSNGIYVTILLGVFEFLEEIYTINCLKYDMFFSPDTDKRDEKENPTVILNSTTGTAKFYVDFSITGKDKYLAKHKVILYYPRMITLQRNVKQKDFVQVYPNESKCVIDVSKLVHEESKKIDTTKIKVNLTVMQKESGYSGTEKPLNLVVECNWFRKFLFLKTKTNKLKIKLKD